MPSPRRAPKQPPPIQTPIPSASPEVRREWLRRVEAEYHSCAVTQHLTLWLIQIGASPDLITAGFAVAADELGHAQQSHAVYRAAAGDGLPNVSREHLLLTRTESDPLEHDVLRSGVELFCLGETVAVPLFKELRKEATVPIARATLDRVLVDEVRHRDFGWALLGWLLETPHEKTLREILDAELPAMLKRVCESYAPPRAEPAPSAPNMPPEERAWGLMPSAIYAAVMHRTFQRDYHPRFSRLGITCPPSPLAD